MQTDYRIRPITVAEYHRMGDLGIITHDERVELLDGELIQMAPIGPDHASAVRELNELFVTRFSGIAVVDVQNPLALDGISEPEPDFMLLAPREHRYRRRIPAPGDVLLVVEIANTSWRYDRGRKLRAYARRGITELWIVRVETETLHRFREPAGEGYASEELFTRGDAVAPAAFPEVGITIAELFPE